MAEEAKTDKKEDKKEENKEDKKADRKDAAPVDANAQEMKDLLAKTEISLLLDSYDDIFSDFDPRPYSQRALSDDFLSEARKAARDKTGSLELRFLVPVALRKPEQESIIKRRIREHFKRHVGIMEKDSKKILRNAIIMTVVGFILLTLATFITHLGLRGFVFTFFTVILEPSGWFLIWTGFDQMFFKGKEKNPELVFYTKMSKANITFSSF